MRFLNHLRRTWPLCLILCLMLTCGIAACSMTGQHWTGFGRTRRIKSFLGVGFGESLDDAMRQYPNGSVETSPYGAPAYRLDHQDAGTVEYKKVIYEFNDAGMQLAIAHFTPSSAGDVLKQLTQSLGEPSSSGGTDPSDPSTVHASWAFPNGETVDFSGPAHRLTLIGPLGETLKQDVRLREAAGSD